MYIYTCKSKCFSYNFFSQTGRQGTPAGHSSVQRCIPVILWSALYVFRHIFFLYIHQNNIIAHLTDIAEGNDILFFPSQKTTDTAWTGYNQSQHTASLHIKIHIPHKAQALAVLYINDFLLFQIIYSRGLNLRLLLTT